MTWDVVSPSPRPWQTLGTYLTLSRMTAQADIEALIRRADTEYKSVEKDKRADFAGVTAMAGLTILARHIDALVGRLDRDDLNRGSAQPGVESALADLRREVDDLTAEVRNGGRDRR